MRKIPDEETRKSVREFFGITLPLERKPIPSNSFNTLVKIYSLLPDQENNPFAKYTNCPEYSTTYAWPKWNVTGLNDFPGNRPDKDGVRDSSVPRRNKEASNVSVHSSGVEVGESSFHNEFNSDRTSGALCKDGVLSGPEMIIDELRMSKNSEMLDKIAYDEEGTNVETIRFRNVHEDLSSIQRILMDESDDLDMLQLLDKDVNLDLARDLGSILDMDRSGDKSLALESIENEKLTTGEIMKEDVVDETKRKDVEVNRSTSEGDVGISQAQKSVDMNQDVTCLKDARTNDTKLCEQNVPQELSEIGGLASIGLESENVMEFSSGKIVDNLGRRNRLVVSGLSAKGKKTKVKNAKMSEKDVVSGKHKLLRVEGEAYNSMTSGDDDLMVHGKTLKQNALGMSRSPATKEDKESWPKNLERLRYTREQLLNLGKTAFIPEHIKKAAREIGVEIHEKHQISAAFKVADSSILKKKRGGSSSEAKKEKKKSKKRKKRAELNRKLGVKRLKLKPVVKPKVVQHCRHYLMGRCYEGDKCKFSHDVVPLTKSKPCCHFARQACMKGDECPFDHQLSKYPCNSYADTGFCSRGESCLFSHKIPVKAASEPSAMLLKFDTSSVDQHDISKSKQQADTSVPSTSGKATPKNLKEMLATQTIKPGKRPKGLSFFSFGTSKLDDSFQPKESDMSQQSSNTAGTNVQPNMVAGAASDLRKRLLNIPGSGTQEGIDYPSFEKTPVGSSGGSKQQSLPPRRDDSSRHNSSGKALLNDHSKSQLKGTSGRSDCTVGTPTQDGALNFSESFKDTPTSTPTPTPTPERALNLSGMFKGTPTPTPTLIPERALNLSEMLKGIPTPTPISERALNLSEMFKGPTPTPIPERAPNLSAMFKGTPTPTPTPTSLRAPILSEMFKGPTLTPTPIPERAPNLSEMLKGTPTPTPEMSLNLSEMLKGALTRAKAKGSSVSFSDVPSSDISKSKSVLSTKEEKGNINASEKLKEIQPEPGQCGSQTSSSQFLSKVDLPVKKPPNSSQRALQSALAFASKYESGIKRSCVAVTKVKNLNDRTSCSNSRQSEPLQASKILPFLNHKGDEEKK